MQSLIFLVDLVQDVTALRDIIAHARTTTRDEVLVLRSSRFIGFDKLNIWAAELDQLCKSSGIKLLPFEEEMDVYRILLGKEGLLISASESSVPAHSLAHRIFASAPSSFLRITVQHGYECVGFLHNRAHDSAYGRHVTFNADVLAAWADVDALTSVAYSERSKIFVGGPPMALRGVQRGKRAVGFQGIVCENLHSVRLQGTGVQAEFLNVVEQIGERFSDAGGKITLRPHPTGQFSSKQDISAINGIQFSAPPIYRADLAAFTFAITPPSSIVMDLILADVPVAIWQDANAFVDTSNYEGLAHVTTADDCWQFALRSLTQRDSLLQLQKRFLQDTGMPMDVAQRFDALLKLRVARGHQSRVA